MNSDEKLENPYNLYVVTDFIGLEYYVCAKSFEEAIQIFFNKRSPKISKIEYKGEIFVSENDNNAVLQLLQ